MNTIIIPHWDMNAYLAWTLWSIGRSARQTGCRDYEVLVVDGGSANVPEGGGRVRVISLPSARWNKPQLLNCGIDAARGDVLTFLDADMMVGENWLNRAAALETRRDVMRLCYRVRHMPTHRWLQCQYSTDRERFVAWLFERYDHFDLAYEAYGSHNQCKQPATSEQKRRVFGNSQFSMKRQVLGELRFNESMTGHGTEDLEFLQRLEEAYGDDYAAAIFTRGSDALLHIPHEHRWRRAALPQCSQAALIDEHGTKQAETVRYMPPDRE